MRQEWEGCNAPGIPAGTHDRNVVATLFHVNSRHISYWVKKGCPYTLNAQGHQRFHVNSVYDWHCKYNDKNRTARQKLSPIPKPQESADDAAPQAPPAAPSAATWELPVPAPVQAMNPFTGSIESVEEALETRSLKSEERLYLDDFLQVLKVKTAKEKVRAQRLDTERKEKNLIALADVNDLLVRISNVYRRFAKQLQRQFGEDALTLWNEHLDDLKEIST